LSLFDLYIFNTVLDFK